MNGFQKHQAYRNRNFTYLQTVFQHQKEWKYFETFCRYFHMSEIKRNEGEQLNINLK